ncbi:MAG: TM1266 family iron-only hydrogenase system putative regulator [Candidatus Omnitrophota bacterium]
MNKRLGFVGIIVEDRQKNASQINNILSNFGDKILSRTGMPYKQRGCSIITLIVEATTDEIGSLSGKLGNVNGVTVKSALSKE